MAIMTPWLLKLQPGLPSDLFEIVVILAWIIEDSWETLGTWENVFTKDEKSTLSKIYEWNLTYKLHNPSKKSPTNKLFSQFQNFLHICGNWHVRIEFFRYPFRCYKIISYRLITLLEPGNTLDRDYTSLSYKSSKSRIQLNILKSPSLNVNE